MVYIEIIILLRNIYNFLIFVINLILIFNFFVILLLYNIYISKFLELLFKLYALSI